MPRKHNHQHRAAHRRHLATDATLYVSITKAASLAKCSRPTVYARIKSGRYQTTHIAGRLVVIKASLGAQQEAK